MTNADDRALGRVLVTGAAGFIGREVVATLRRRGLNVVGIDVETADTGSEGLLACDLTDDDRFDSIVREGAFGTILHCGGVSGPMVLADRPDLVWRINALGTANVMEAARRHAVGRVVVCSTTDVYRQAGAADADESAALEPASVYGASKVAAEQVAMAYHRQEGVDAVALRLAWVYGPNRKTPTDLTLMIAAGASGKALVMSDHPEDYTYYFHVGDAVAGLVRAASKRDLQHRIFNISGGRGQTLAEVAQIVGQHFPGLDVRFESRSPSRPGPVGIDFALARRELGYCPELTLEEGIEKQIESLRAPRAAR